MASPQVDTGDAGGISFEILLVDDDELVRFALAEVLNDAGFEVMETGDPNQALGILWS